MERLFWDKKYETGIDVIDFQHRILLERTNDLIDLVNKNEAQDNMFPILIFLEDYTLYHFDTEEQFFDSFDYKDKEKHLEEHREFIKKIIEFKEQYAKGTVKIDKDLLDYLLNWLISHILGTDMSFAKDLIKNISY